MNAFGVDHEVAKYDKQLGRDYRSLNKDQRKKALKIGNTAGTAGGLGMASGALTLNAGVPHLIMHDAHTASMERLGNAALHEEGYGAEGLRRASANHGIVAAAHKAKAIRRFKQGGVLMGAGIGAIAAGNVANRRYIKTQAAKNRGAVAKNAFGIEVAKADRKKVGDGLVVGGLGTAGASVPTLRRAVKHGDAAIKLDQRAQDYAATSGIYRRHADREARLGNADSAIRSGVEAGHWGSRAAEESEHAERVGAKSIKLARRGAALGAVGVGAAAAGGALLAAGHLKPRRSSVAKNAFGVEITKADAPVYRAMKAINGMKVKGVPKSGGTFKRLDKVTDIATSPEGSQNVMNGYSAHSAAHRLRATVKKDAFGVEKAFNPMKAMDGTFDVARAGKQAMGGLKSMVSGAQAKMPTPGPKMGANMAGMGKKLVSTPKAAAATAATAGTTGFVAGQNKPTQSASRKTLFGKRDFSAQTREKLADKGHAMPDGSFPINSAEDLANAIRLAGRSKNPGAARAFICRRAKAMGLEDKIPEGWESGPDDDHDADDKVTKSAFGVEDGRVSKDYHAMLPMGVQGYHYSSPEGKKKVKSSLKRMRRYDAEGGRKVMTGALGGALVGGALGAPVRMSGAGGLAGTVVGSGVGTVRAYNGTRRRAINAGIKRGDVTRKKR